MVSIWEIKVKQSNAFGTKPDLAMAYFLCSSSESILITFAQMGMATNWLVATELNQLAHLSSLYLGSHLWMPLEPK